MLSSVRPSRPCRGLVVVTTCAALLGATASVAQSTPNGPPICQPGATLQDLEYVLQRYAGYYTEEEIRSNLPRLMSTATGSCAASPSPMNGTFRCNRFMTTESKGAGCLV